MRNYRIAFFTVDWNYELVESTLHGLKQFVDDHEHVNLCVFDCFGKDLDNARSHSEYAIFELADLTQFDGLLVQGNQIVLQSVRQSIARRVAETGIPTVTIDCPIEGCSLVSIDNALAQRELAEHVIRSHGARRLVYLTGLLDNGCPEGQQRLDGFLSACRDNGIPEEDIEVIRCTWRTSDGADVAQRWLDEGRPLPDAFICGNDEMALGLMETLEKGGVRIPADVIVTGFDNLTSAELSNPRLSTVHRDCAGLNYLAMEVLMRKIDGEAAEDFTPFDYSIIASESCGCGTAERPGYIRDKYFHQTRFLKNFYTLQDRMAEQLFDASDLLELIDIVEKNHQIFGCDNMYLCINDYYFDNYDKKQWHHDTKSFGQEMILATCGQHRLSEDRLFERFPTSVLLPAPLLQSERFLVFYPLHYNTCSIGYLAMDDISEASKLNLHESIFTFLEIAIENVRKKVLLRQLNEVLDDLYVRDALTGLYNRFGYERFARPSFDLFLADSGGVQVLFVDMDDMKGINDRFGHEIGDDAIRAAAQVLRTACGPKDFLMRYGGDEFLVIAPRREADLSEAIQQALREGGHCDGLPCPLSLSVGAIHVGPDSPRTLEDCVQAADQQMYDRKKRKKAGGQ